MINPSQLAVSSGQQAASYLPECCAFCNGSGAGFDSACVACNGKGKVMVLQPSLKCPRCGGSGKPKDVDRVLYYSCLCLVCRGTGWVLTLD
jgi:DnaJ-class molecular chaperone